MFQSIYWGVKATHPTVFSYAHTFLKHQIQRLSRFQASFAQTQAPNMTCFETQRFIPASTLTIFYTESLEALQKLTDNNKWVAECMNTCQLWWVTDRLVFVEPQVLELTFSMLVAHEMTPTVGVVRTEGRHFFLLKFTNFQGPTGTSLCFLNTFF